MSESDSEKNEAARAAAGLVRSGMVVGLGTGSTASRAVRFLGERMRDEGLQIVGVPSSVATATLANSVGIPLTDLDDVPALDIDIDGADEVDPRFRMIKGRGGALLREKIVAAAARWRVIVVSAGKRVERLGRHAPVPVEVSGFGIKHTEHSLRNLGASTSLRRNPDGTAYLTDEGHLILDCRFLDIADPEALNLRLNAVVGVFETGLFIDLCDTLIVGGGQGVEVIEKPPAVTSAI